jgi:hypothetical protein
MRIEPTGRQATDKSRQIGILFLFGLLIGIFVALIILVGKEGKFAQLREGDISLKTVYSPFDFSYISGVDETLTQKARQEAAGKIRDLYDIGLTSKEAPISLAKDFFWGLRQVKQGLPGQAPPFKLSESSLRAFSQAENLDDIEKRFISLLERFYSQPILSASERERLASLGQAEIIIRDPAEGKERQVKVSSVITPDSAEPALESLSLEIFPENRRMRQAVVELAKGLIRPNLSFNEAQTQSRRKEASQKVPLIYKEAQVKKDELIIAKGEKVTKEHLRKLDVLTKGRSLFERIQFISGIVLITFALIFSFTLYLAFFQLTVISPRKDLVLVGLSVLLVAGLAKAVVISPLPSYIIPVAFAPMLITILLENAAVALLVSVILCLIAALIAGGNINLIVTFMVASIIGICSIWRARHRDQLIRAGLLVGLASFICISALGLINNLEPRVFIREGSWGLLNGLLCSFIIAGSLPVFENLFGFITNISLLELSDLNQPLLKEMVMRAPGTYHHSLVVANLAESAAETIGANSLLAKVGAYYHDIGKIEKAEYFSENQMDRSDKHENLPPSMSRLIIINHVKNGIELARKYRLKKAIIPFIQQHHGTGLVYYFYQRALEEVNELEIEEEEFRYTGPRPQNKEIAIVLLADSVEAASRALQEPTPARIDSLVRRIINNKFIDGQLDECDLTLRDLNKIAEIFSRILTGIFHVRVDYTKKANENRDNKPSEKTPTPKQGEPEKYS